MFAMAMASVRVAAKPAVARQFARAAPGLRAPAIAAPRFHTAAPCLAAYTSSQKGVNPSLEFRVFFDEGGKAVSPWHDVPLYNADGTCNFICEIPKESKAKMEVATDEELTPIKQDTKKGKLRDYPYNINWNYGMLPQTWEDPTHEHPVMKVMGDNDPVVRPAPRGDGTPRLRLLFQGIIHPIGQSTTFDINPPHPRLDITPPCPKSTASASTSDAAPCIGGVIRVARPAPHAPTPRTWWRSAARRWGWGR